MEAVILLSAANWAQIIEKTQEREGCSLEAALLWQMMVCGTGS